VPIETDEIKRIASPGERALVARVLVEIASALNEGAAGPCDYWNKQVAMRLINRALRVLEKG